MLSEQKLTGKQVKELLKGNKTVLNAIDDMNNQLQALTTS